MKMKKIERMLVALVIVVLMIAPVIGFAGVNEVKEVNEESFAGKGENYSLSLAQDSLKTLNLDNLGNNPEQIVTQKNATTLIDNSTDDKHEYTTPWTS